jgi:uncharacterized membrane protein
VSTQRAAPIGALQVLRATTHFVALLIVSTAALLALVASSLPDATRIALAAFGVAIAAMLLLLVHQSIGRMTGASVILFAMAFVVPKFFVHETLYTALCRGSSTPCTPMPNSHPGLRLGLAAVLLSAALVTAAMGRFRSSRGAVG